MVNKTVIHRDSSVDVESIREQMRAKQKIATMKKTGIRLCANVFLVTIVLLPLLYACLLYTSPSPRD